MSAPAASAQFTAGVVPVKSVARRDSQTVRDSTKKAAEDLASRVEGMKAWVDSVALNGTAAPKGVAVGAGGAPGDSGAKAVDSVRLNDTTATAKLTVPPADSGPTARAAPQGRQFKNGMPAPATATNLPLLLALGAGCLAVGLALRRS